jgi:hypothetical protein
MLFTSFLMLNFLIPKPHSVLFIIQLSEFNQKQLIDFHIYVKEMNVET